MIFLWNIYENRSFDCSKRNIWASTLEYFNQWNCCLLFNPFLKIASMVSQSLSRSGLLSLMILSSSLNFTRIPRRKQNKLRHHSYSDHIHPLWDNRWIVHISAFSNGAMCDCNQMSDVRWTACLRVHRENKWWTVRRQSGIPLKMDAHPLWYNWRWAKQNSPSFIMLFKCRSLFMPIF